VNQIVSMERTLKVPLGGAYVAALLAEQARDEDTYSQLCNAIKGASIQSDPAARWIKKIAQDDGQRIISFRRSELDQYMAGAMYPLGQKVKFHLYSDEAIGELGFYSLSDVDGAIWVDRYALSGDRTTGSPILEPNGLKSLVYLVGLVDKTPLLATISQHDEFLIDLQAPWLEYLGLKEGEMMIGAYLIPAPSDDSKEGRKQTSLGVLRLKITGKATWSLKAPPERAMQIHAASSNGQFLYITLSDRLRFAFELPDFLADSPMPKRVYSDLEHGYSPHLGWHCSSASWLAATLVQRLMNRYDWVCPSDPMSWIELIAKKKSSPL
jgi:hypothetical protein